VKVRGGAGNNRTPSSYTMSPTGRLRTVRSNLSTGYKMCCAFSDRGLVDSWTMSPIDRHKTCRTLLRLLCAVPNLQLDQSLTKRSLTTCSGYSRSPFLYVRMKHDVAVLSKWNRHTPNLLRHGKDSSCLSAF
jgi:hypothetical protein